MKKVYKFFMTFLPVLLCGIGLNVIFSVVAYGLDFDKVSATYKFPATTTILFFVFLGLSVGFAFYFSANTKHLYITKIRKKSNFLKLSSWLAASVLIFLFLVETARLVAFDHIADPAKFDGWRIARYVLTIPFAAYFIIMVFPTKIKKKKIIIPNAIKYILDIVAIAWCIVSVFSFYFYDKLTITNSFMIWEIVLYTIAALFFVFEARFEHLKANNFLYVLFASLLCIVSFTYSISSIIALSSNFFQVNTYSSEPQLLADFGIGLYALARLYAIPKTMKHVMDNDDSGSFSSKFNKQPDDFASDDDE